jgi:tryptophanyl-tRNA synthetase
VLPEAVIEESVALLPGLDGRKMSKSYDNTIPLFAPARKCANKSQASSPIPKRRASPRPRKARRCSRFTRPLPAPDETAAMARAYAEGIGWADAKQMLFERIDREIAPMREHYQSLIDNPAQMDKILLAGADKARQAGHALHARVAPCRGPARLVIGQYCCKRPKKPKPPCPASSNTAKRRSVLFQAGGCKRPGLAAKQGICLAQGGWTNHRTSATEGPDALADLKPILEFAPQTADFLIEVLTLLKAHTAAKQK